MNHYVIGILAHVDAGKTTLSESLLYLSKAIRKKGRVDHQDAYLDYDSQERDRGITIFSKQARFSWKNTDFTLIDTPGHVDFSGEMERSLSVLDAAVLVVNGCDGVQSHTETIWKLLKHYHLPVIVFVNKMDISYVSKKELAKNLHRLDEKIIDVSSGMEQLYEQIAMVNDEMLEKYINHEMNLMDIREAVSSREVFPCIFGSALKEEGVEQLLDLLAKTIKEKTYPQLFGARVYKITHDENQKKWVHLKITGGQLNVKDKLGEDKVDQIRLYSGEKYENVQMVKAGEVCSVSGLNQAQIYDGFGFETQASLAQLTSFMKYRMILPKDCDTQQMLKNLKTLSEEDPLLRISYEEELKEIHVQLMGEVQIDILKNIILKRFHVPVEFDQGSVVFMETICESVEGVGHFEPLRHYAEVHLLLEPQKRGSGLVFENQCSEDQLSGNWQRLIMTHLTEKTHKGVLSGSPITDMKITLIAGKAHNKHTEGGDFRQATYRAVRQGLRKTKCMLLEPYYSFTLMIPANVLSKAIFDLEQRHGTFEIKDHDNNMCVLIGKAPIRYLQDYQLEVMSYTKGAGRLSCTICGYEPCVNQDEVIEQIGYDCDADLQNPCGSVFCQHGSGFYVPYDAVEDYMHIKNIKKSSSSYEIHQRRKIDEKELQAVYDRTLGPVKTRIYQKPKEDIELTPIRKMVVKKQCLLVDGYNIIHSWKSLSQLASVNLDAARDRLIDLLSSYQGYKNCLLILVFDAYKIKDNAGSKWYNGSIHIVYTKTAQSADTYIEATTHELSKDYQISVATSDSLEQLIIMGQGARRISAREFEKEVDYQNKTSFKEYESRQSKMYHQQMEKIRKLNEKE